MVFLHRASKLLLKMMSWIITDLLAGTFWRPEIHTTQFVDILSSSLKNNIWQRKSLFSLVSGTAHLICPGKHFTAAFEYLCKVRFWSEATKWPIVESLYVLADVLSQRTGIGSLRKGRAVHRGLWWYVMSSAEAGGGAAETKKSRTHSSLSTGQPNTQKEQLDQKMNT